MENPNFIIEIDTNEAVKSIKELTKAIDSLVKKAQPKWWQLWKRITININYPKEFIDIKITEQK